MGARGGRGGAGSGGSLPSTEALLVCACPRVGRASVLNLLSFECAPFSLSGPGGRCFREMSTTGGGGFGGYMPAGREGRRDASFSFALPPLNFHGARGRGGVGFGGLLPSVAALLECACQRIRRESGLNFVFALAPFNFLGPGVGVFGGFLHLTAALLVDTCERDERGSALHRFVSRFHC